jgi:N6-L-threonylcarbamoyladenine synthase
MIVLGIETSCDETAVGIVDCGKNILSNQVYSQIKEHKPHGGVVPEIAARAHVQVLDGLVKAAVQEAGIKLTDIDGIAATCGPGLIGGVMVGMMTGKGLAASLNKPFLAVNHLEAHVLTPRLTDDVPFPYLTLLISGGHTQILLAHGLGHYELLGSSLDDACGEAFDKSAKLMGLEYPGGPMIEKLARECTNIDAACAAFPLPRPMLGRQGCDFSFSGLKTAMREMIYKLEPDCHPGNAAGVIRDLHQAQELQKIPDKPFGLSGMTRADLCASLQTAIGDVLCDRIDHACDVAVAAGAKHFVIAGGVAANVYLRDRLTKTVAAHGLTLMAPPIKLCTDNGVMIAWAGIEMLQAGRVASLDVAARPRWPMIELKGAV